VWLYRPNDVRPDYVWCSSESESASDCDAPEPFAPQELGCISGPHPLLVRLILRILERLGHLKGDVWAEDEARIQIAATTEAKHDVVPGEEGVLVSPPLVGEGTHLEDALVRGHGTVARGHLDAIEGALNASTGGDPSGAIVAMGLGLNELGRDVGTGDVPVCRGSEGLLVDLEADGAHPSHDSSDVVDLGETSRNGEVEGIGDTRRRRIELVDDVAVDFESDFLGDAADELCFGVEPVERSEVILGLRAPASLELAGLSLDGQETDVDVDIRDVPVAFHVVPVGHPNDVAIGGVDAELEVRDLAIGIVDGTRGRTSEPTRSIVDVTLDDDVRSRVVLLDRHRVAQVGVERTNWVVLKDGRTRTTSR